MKAKSNFHEYNEFAAKKTLAENRKNIFEMDNFVDFCFNNFFTKFINYNAVVNF